MAVASVTKITAASSESFDAAVREGLARANILIRFHLGGVVAVRIVRIAADRRAHAVAHCRSDQRIIVLKPLDFAETPELRGALLI